MIGAVKNRTFQILSASGVSTRLGASAWRRRRLLILAYHGLALEDEHEWNPSLFFSREAFARRLAILRELGATVLPLDEAVTRLADGTLPERAVCLTFDDGNRDFLEVGVPLLATHDFPATVYVTTSPAASIAPSTV